ncbi:hypothetical protein MVEN_01756700 [Mycena venus]|uniref:Uncharacterized protein n=1 Tax=Mycena venus TaxID=2733690 RepID=A0A8H6XMS9_9AGAR|nr:hypothetical protein MVEN_01756700 [Mycena venus]
MSTHIPQELVDIIMDNLDDDIPSLKSCSLAARTFVSSAQIQIFRKIEITPPTHPLSLSSSCQKLYKLLTSSPHLAPLVDELCIVLVGSETSFEYDADGQYLEDRHVTWIMSGRKTLALILALLDLKRISLVENAPVDWNSYGQFSMKWNELGGHLKSELSRIFSSPGLESVHLRGIVVESPYQLLSLFSEATSLKEMSLSRVYFTKRWDQRDPWPESQTWQPQLRSLLLSDIASDTFCRHLVNPRINLTRVNSLTIVTEGSDWREKIIQATHGSVVDLRIRYLQEPGTGVFKSIIGPNLRSLPSPLFG